MNLIGFAGRIGSGKSFAARHVAARTGGFAIVKFAAPLKEMLAALYRQAGLDQAGIAARIEGALKDLADPTIKAWFSGAPAGWAEEMVAALNPSWPWLTAGDPAEAGAIAENCRQSLARFAQKHWAESDMAPRFLMQTLGTEWGRAMQGEDFWVDCWEAAAHVARQKAPGVIADDVRFANEAARIRELGGRVIHIIADDEAFVSGHVSEHIDFIPDAAVRNFRDAKFAGDIDAVLAGLEANVAPAS